MTDLGKSLVVLGILIALAGVVLWSGFGRDWLGRLPGDLRIERENARFYFPITTCLLASAVISLILWLLRK